MKIKQMTSCMLKSTLKIVACYYGLLVLLATATYLIFTVALSTDGSLGFRGTTVIFVFVIGIVSFYTYIKTGFSFSVSRRTVFLSLLISALVIAALTAMVDSIFTLVVPLLFPRLSEAVFLFGDYSASFDILSVLCYYCVEAFAFLCAGFFTGGLYYRMNKGLKIGVSVGVPALVIIGIPMALVSLPPVILNSIGNLLALLFTFAQASPFNSMLFYLLGAAIATLFLWLLIRRAPVKEPT